MVAPRASLAERLDRLEREPRGEHAEILEQLALRVGEQAHAPVDRRAHRAMPFGKVAHGRRQQRQAPLQTLRDAGGAQDAHLRRRELDRQRQPLEPAADVGQVAGVLGGDVEVGVDRPRPVDEQRHGGRARRAVQARRPIAGRRRQRRHLEHALAADAQHDAARHQERRRRRDRVQPHEHGCGIHDLLEVVEHDQHPAIGEGVGDALLERGFAVVADAEIVGDRRQQQSGLEHALEEHEVHAVGEHVAARQGRLDREPALADAAGADEAHHAIGAACQERPDGVDVGLAADRRGVGDRHPADQARASPAPDRLPPAPAIRRSVRRGAWRGRRRPGLRGRRRCGSGGRRRCRRPGCGR